MTDEQPSPADALAAAVAEQVAIGRSDGTYPAGLESDLDAHWRRVAARPDEVPRHRLHRAFDDYVDGAAFSVPAPPPSSGAPGGAAIHKIVGKTVSRHMSDLVLQLDDFARSVQEMFASIIAVLDDVPAHVHTDLIGQLEAMEGQLAELGRAANRAAAGGERP